MNKFLVLLITVVAFFSCNKDATLVDENLNNDLLDFEKVDSFKLKSYTIKDNTANGKNLSNVLLGSINDPRFGSSKASFYSQMSITQNAFELGSNPVLDSVVLILDQVKTYGSLNANFDLAVYRLNQEILSDETYDNSTVLNLTSPPLASLSNYKFSSTNKEVRIRLDDSFGNELINQFETTVMESSDNFKAFFNGIYVTAASVSGDGIVNFNLITDNSRMALYFSSDVLTDTVYNYVIENTDISINQYTKNSAGSEAQIEVDNGTDNEEISYISSMSNFKTALEFPDLSALNKNIVNKAQLTIYQADYGTSLSNTFPEPDQLFLFQNNNDTGLLFLPDFTIGATSLFGGSKELVEINGQNTYKYTFNITKYIQNLINGTADSETLFITDFSNNEGNRIKINGGAHPSLPIKLELLFTKQN